MLRLKGVFENNTKTIQDMSPNQAIEVANIAFKHHGTIAWTISCVNEQGYWLNGVDKLSIKYYCYIDNYFQIHGTKTFPKDHITDGEQYELELGKIQLSWEYGLPYINLVGWFLENGFNVFTNYPKNYFDKFYIPATAK